MMVEYINIINIIRDKREEHKYIYKTFKCNNINCLMFFFHYKHLFNVNLNYLKIRIIPHSYEENGGEGNSM